ncbi:MAG: SIS domain-containing protein [Promethearchaeia archaeon]
MTETTDKSSERLGKITEKEIYEIPATLKRVLKTRKYIQEIAHEIVNREIRHIYLIGAGTSYHAGFAISYLFNKWLQIPTFTEYSMEFQYLIEPILKKDDCIIGLSQSGETKDTIESIEIGKSKGCLTLAVTNHPDSKLARICDFNLDLDAGEEKSVLATKTYVSQLVYLAMLAIETANLKKNITNSEYEEFWEELNSIPVKIETILPDLHAKIKDYSNYFKFAEFCFILGGGQDYAAAMEASLKLKEGARIFGQAYSTAEFPHGPITLADSKAWVIAIIPEKDDKRKRNILNLLRRIKEKKATILGFYSSDEMPDNIDFGIRVPSTYKDLQPTLTILGIQLLTLEIARIKNLNCDTPKFLTKVSGI